MRSMSPGSAGITSGRGQRIFIKDFVYQVRDVVGDKRPLPGQKLVQHHTQAIHVGTMGQRLIANLLWRHIGGRADIDGLRHIAVLKECGTEIGDLHVGVFAQHDVLGLDIPVYDAKAVCVIQRSAAFECDLYRILHRQKIVALRVYSGEIISHRILHDDVTGPPLSPQHQEWTRCADDAISLRGKPP